MRPRRRHTGNPPRLPIPSCRRKLWHACYHAWSAASKAGRPPSSASLVYAAMASPSSRYSAGSNGFVFVLPISLTNYIVAHPPPAPGYRLPATGSQLQATGSQLPATGCRPLTSVPFPLHFSLALLIPASDTSYSLKSAQERAATRGPFLLEPCLDQSSHRQQPPMCIAAVGAVEPQDIRRPAPNPSR